MLLLDLNAFLFSNPPLPLLASGEVIDDNSGAPAKGNSGVLVCSSSSFLSLFVTDLFLSLLHLFLAQAVEGSEAGNG
jgi:hypothetical protein